MLCRRAFALCLIACLVGVGCSDDTNTDDEQAGNWKHQDLDGPWGDNVDYRGPIGDGHAFAAESGRFPPARPVAVHVLDDDGKWQTRSVPNRALTIYTDRHHIVQAGDAHFYVNEFGGGSAEIYRSEDAAQTWTEEPLEGAPSTIERLYSDGEVLFWPEPLFEEGDGGPDEGISRLHRSTDGGETWEVIEERVEFGSVTAAAGGWVVAQPEGGQYQVSEDGGDSWQEMSSPVNVDSDRAPIWHELDGHYLVADAEGTSQISVWSDADAFTRQTIEGAPNSVQSIAVADGNVYASKGDRLGRLSGHPSEWADGDLPEWEDLDTPNTDQVDACVPFWQPVPDGEQYEPDYAVYGYPNGDLVLVSGACIFRTSNEGDSWQQVEPIKFTPAFVAESSDSIITGAADTFLERKNDADHWEVLERPMRMPDHALVVETGDWNLAVTNGGHGVPELYQFDEFSSDEEAELVWSDDAAGQQQMHAAAGYGPAAHLLEHDGTLYVGSAGNFSEVIVADGNTPFDKAGGGLFAIDLDSGEIEHLTDGFEGAGQPQIVSSMYMYDGDIWGVTATQGVWRFDPETGEAEPDGRGLPRDKDPQTQERHVGNIARGLTVFNDRLYAYSTNRIFVYDGDVQWDEVSLAGLDNEAELEVLDFSSARHTSNAIVDVHPFGDFLLVNTLEGLYEVALDAPDAASGYRAVDVDFDLPVYGVFPSSDAEGVYVALWQGGLHWLEPNY